MADKLKALVLGPGNIGTDLLMKARRSEWIEPAWVVGVEQSEGIQRAQDMGVKTCIAGIDGVLQHSADPGGSRLSNAGICWRLQFLSLICQACLGEIRCAR